MSAPLLDPTNDYVFKRLLADSPSLLSSLINAVRNDLPPVFVERILNPTILPEELSGKVIVLDLLARDAEGRRFNVEMQARRHPDWAMRSMIYLARTLGEQIGRGQGYGQLRPAIGIHLLDFTMFDDPAQADWRFQMRDRRQPVTVLADTLELNLLELPKAQALGNLPNPILAWVTFFERWKEDATMTTIDDPAVRDALRKLEALSAETEARIQAELRDKALRDEVSLREWERAEGRREGREEGRIAGEALMLQRMLVRRFGALPADALVKLASADAATLERWSDRLLDAESLGQVMSRD